MTIASKEASGKTAALLTPERQKELFHQMVRIRRFEEMTHELYKQGKLLGMSPHLAIGQEAAEAGVVSQLRDNDYILSTHRGHGHCLAKGADMGRMYAELFAKETGYCRGRGGSMHIADVSKGNLGANGIVGAGLPIAVGAGMSIKRAKTDQIVVCGFGDAATNQGTFHESLNMAKAFNLPILWLCENNCYGLSTRYEHVSATPRASDRAKGYDMTGVTIDGMDVEAVWMAAHELIAGIRTGSGPVLLELLTYRYFGHGASDNRSYRTREEEQQWWERCPVAAYRAKLLEKGVAGEEELAAIEKTVDEEVACGVEFAAASPDPDPANLLDNIYSE